MKKIKQNDVRVREMEQARAGALGQVEMLAGSLEASLTWNVLTGSLSRIHA